MVEMLGVLAVMGILSVAGVSAYTYAMNRHRANELIYEANKRATSVAMQIAAGRNMNALSISDFPNPAGYTFGVEPNPSNANQFNITIDAVDTDICKQMKATVGTATSIRVISSYCDKLTFNKDLSHTAYPSDYDTNTSACNSSGYTWCSKGDDGIDSKCSTESDCCATVTYDSQCQSCDSSTGTVMNLGTTNNPQSCDFKNDPTKPSTCNAGVCLDPDITTTTKCLTNADCGGVGSGYYCKITKYDSSVYCSQDVPTIVGCPGETNPMNCGENGSKAGTCTQVGTIIKANISGIGQVFVGPSVRWWSAKNWCEAIEKRLIDVEDLKVYYGTNSTTLLRNKTTKTPYACAQGKTCSQWDSGAASAMWDGNRTLTNAKDANGEPYRIKYSPIMVNLAENFKGIYDKFWTNSIYSGGAYSQGQDCFAYYGLLNRGQISYWNRNEVYYTICL